MLAFKFDVGNALERAGVNMYKAKKTNILSQDTLKKIKNEDTNISLESLNKICAILDLQPKDILIYIDNEEEKKKIFENF